MAPVRIKVVHLRDSATYFNFSPVNVLVDKVPLVLNLASGSSTAMLEIYKGVRTISVVSGELTQSTIKYDFHHGDYYVLVGSNITVQKMEFGKSEADFDIQAYMGKWYQIASIPQFYEQGVDRFVAQYTWLQNGVQVYNVGYDKNWLKINDIEGLALPINDSAVLNVAFPSAPIEIPSWYPNYIVHETDYENYAIVGSPKKNSLYFLSRTSSVSKCEYQAYLRRAARYGYDVNKIVANYGTVAASTTTTRV